MSRPHRRTSAPPRAVLGHFGATAGAVRQFLAWVFAGPRLFRVSARFAPIGFGLWLITGLPTLDDGRHHAALQGAPHVLAAVAGLALIAAYFRIMSPRIGLERRRTEDRRARRSAHD